MELDQHEAECALRYEMVNKTLEQLDKRLWRLEAIVIVSNLTVLGSDGTEELNVQDGAIYYDTTLNKEYVLYNNTWTEV